MQEDGRCTLSDFACNAENEVANQNSEIKTIVKGTLKDSQKGIFGVNNTDTQISEF